MTRISIDVLRSARVRREEYVGPWFPEPLPTDPYQDRSGRRSWPSRCRWQEIAAGWIGKAKLRHVLNLRGASTGPVPCER